MLISYPKQASGHTVHIFTRITFLDFTRHSITRRTPCDILLRLRQWEPVCARSPSAGVVRGSEEPGLIAAATKSMDAFDLVSKERVNTLGLVKTSATICSVASTAHLPVMAPLH